MRPTLFALSLAIAWVVPAVATAQESAKAAPPTVKGYLEKESFVDSSKLLPPPPAPGSPAHAADDAAYEASKPLVDTARFRLAARDAEYRFPQAATAFSCALGLGIDEAATPQVYTLLRRTFVDAVSVSGKAKAVYRRGHPFVVGNTPICTPDLTESYRKDFTSYPSNNAVVGWVWALVLAELAPDRIDALMGRGYAYGESRVVCGIHWASDVAAARVVGAALYAQLHSNAEFQSQVDAARRELKAARDSRDRSPPDCALETEALGRR